MQANSATVAGQSNSDRTHNNLESMRKVMSFGIMRNPPPGIVDASAAASPVQPGDKKHMPGRPGGLSRITWLSIAETSIGRM